MYLILYHVIARAAQPNLHFNRAAAAYRYEYSHALFSAHPNIFDIP